MRYQGDNEPSIRGAYAVQIANVAKRFGATSKELFDGFPLSEDELSKRGASMPVSDFLRFVRRARELTGEPGLAIHFGMAITVTSHGILSLALLAASHLGEAINLTARFIAIRTGIISLQLEVAGDDASLCVVEHVPLGTELDFIAMAAAVAMWRVACVLTGTLLTGSAEFTFPKPPYFDALLLPLTKAGAIAIRFEQPRNRLIFDASLLDMPLVNADVSACRTAIEYCERELALVETTVPLDVRARAFLDGAQALVPIRATARALAVSTRTLTRKLAEAGTSYSAMLDDALRERAMDLLAGSLSVDAIAEQLGYADQRNFARAFRRWTGQAPSAFRRAARHAPSRSSG